MLLLHLGETVALYTIIIYNNLIIRRYNHKLGFLHIELVIKKLEAMYEIAFIINSPSWTRILSNKIFNITDFNFIHHNSPLPISFNITNSTDKTIIFKKAITRLSMSSLLN